MLNSINWDHTFSFQNPLCQYLNFASRKPGLESPIWPSWGESSRMFCSFLQGANTSSRILLRKAKILLIQKMHKSVTGWHIRINKQWEYELCLQAKGVILGKSFMHLAEILNQPPCRVPRSCSVPQGRYATWDSEDSEDLTAHCSYTKWTTSNRLGMAGGK